MTESDELRSEMFHKFEVFDGLNASELDEIAEFAEVRAIDPGEEILVEGRRDRDLYGMLSGSADVLKSEEGDTPRKIARLTPYTAVGELGLAVGAPRSATVRIAEPSRLLRIDGEGFHQLQTAHRSVAYKVEHNILRILARRLGEMNREMLPIKEQ